MSAKNLSVELSRLKTFSKPKQSLEQHPTTGDIAGHIIWEASLLGWIKEKEVVDLGAGTGILGIGCLLMGAKKCVFVEKDTNAISILKENLSRTTESYEIKDYEIIHSDIRTMSSMKAGLVIMNPPFGTRRKGEDTLFLDKAAQISDRIITFHKTETLDYIKKRIESLKYKILRSYDLNFPLSNTMDHHRKKTQKILVSCLLLER